MPDLTTYEFGGNTSNDISEQENNDKLPCIAYINYIDNLSCVALVEVIRGHSILKFSTMVEFDGQGNISQGTKDHIVGLLKDEFNTTDVRVLPCQQTYFNNEGAYPAMKEGYYYSYLGQYKGRDYFNELYTCIKKLISLEDKVIDNTLNGITNIYPSLTVFSPKKLSVIIPEITLLNASSNVTVDGDHSDHRVNYLTLISTDLTVDYNTVSILKTVYKDKDLTFLDSMSTILMELKSLKDENVMFSPTHYESLWVEYLQYDRCVKALCNVIMNSPRHQEYVSDYYKLFQLSRIHKADKTAGVQFKFNYMIDSMTFKEYVKSLDMLPAEYSEDILSYLNILVQNTELYIRFIESYNSDEDNKLLLEPLILYLKHMADNSVPVQCSQNVMKDYDYYEKHRQELALDIWFNNLILYLADSPENNNQLQRELIYLSDAKDHTISKTIPKEVKWTSGTNMIGVKVSMYKPRNNKQ